MGCGNRGKAWDVAIEALEARHGKRDSNRVQMGRGSDGEGHWGIWAGAC